MKTFAILILPSCFILISQNISAQVDVNNNELQDGIYQNHDSTRFVEHKSMVKTAGAKNESTSSTGANNFDAKAFIAPAAFVAYGFTSLSNGPSRQLNKNICYEVKEDLPGFKTTVDNYLKYAPMVTTYALNIAGVKAKHRLLERTTILAVSSIVTNQIVTSLKHATHQMRPDGSTYNSFPSGHTATAFVGAEFMNQELGWHSQWYSFAGYTMSTATGMLRVANNRHWLSDVIAGAGIGILTTKLTYWVAGKIEKKFTPQQKISY